MGALFMWEVRSEELGAQVRRLEINGAANFYDSLCYPFMRYRGEEGLPDGSG